MTLFPQHGPITCLLCFPEGRDHIERDGWRLDNNPGAWGARDPLILVLGFSKGATQGNAWQRGNFDAVPFAGARQRLTTVLRILGVLTATDTVDGHIRAGERDLTFASLLRCGLAHRDPRSGKLATSGALIKRAFDQPFPAQTLSVCARSYLAALPPRLRLVVMLGSDSGYVDRCARLLGQVGAGETVRSCAVAYRRGSVTFVHATHPSPANGHFQAWAEGAPDSAAGRKRELARAAVRASGQMLPVAAAPARGRRDT